MYLLSSLSYSIASTFKRLSIILITSFIFHKKLSTGNVFGITIASIGIEGFTVSSVGAVLYNIASKRSKRKRKLPELEMKKDLWSTDFVIVK